MPTRAEATPKICLALSPEDSGAGGGWGDCDGCEAATGALFCAGVRGRLVAEAGVSGLRKLAMELLLAGDLRVPSALGERGSSMARAVV